MHTRLIPLLLLLVTACGGSVDSSTGETTQGAAGSSQGGTSAQAGAAGMGQPQGGSAGSIAQGGTGQAGAGGATGGAGGATGGAGGASAGAGGDSGGAAGTSGGGGSGNAGGSVPGASFTGSYDLKFEGIVSSPNKEPWWGDYPSAIKGARLDIRKTPSGYEAVFSGVHEAPAAFAVTETSDAVVLTGEGQINGTGPQLLTDTWKTITLKKNADTTLTGQLTAEGDESGFAGDVGFFAKLTATGVVAPDTQPPAVAVHTSSLHGPEDALLPWDELVVQASEPCDRASFEKALSVIAITPVPGGPLTETPVDAIWQLTPAESEPTAWAGVNRASGRLASWDAGQEAFKVGASSSLLDPSGHGSANYLQPTNIKPMAQPMPSFDLDGDVIFETLFGDVGLLGGWAPDPACEQGGCRRLGPFAHNHCGDPRLGFAGRLDATGKGFVKIRYRVEAGQGFTNSDMPPQGMSDVFGVDQHTHGGAVKVSTVNAPQTWTKKPTPDGDLLWTSEWQTAQVPVLEGAGNDLGFVIYAGNGSLACGGPLPPPVTVAVFIDRIELE